MLLLSALRNVLNICIITSADQVRNKITFWRPLFEGCLQKREFRRKRVVRSTRSRLARSAGSSYKFQKNFYHAIRFATAPCALVLLSSDAREHRYLPATPAFTCNQQTAPVDPTWSHCEQEPPNSHMNIASNKNYDAVAGKIAELDIDICAAQEVLLDPAVDLPGHIWPQARKYTRLLLVLRRLPSRRRS